MTTTSLMMMRSRLFFEVARTYPVDACSIIVNAE